MYRISERLMGMDDDAWARHANPWSVYTRFTCLPLIALAVWSRAWIGWWCLAPLALALLWTWANPRVFNPPASTDNWASQGVMGERLFLNRRAEPVPQHHVRMAYWLTGVSALGMGMLIYGLAALDASATLGGMAVTVGGKAWFVDRMVWLYRDAAGGR